MYTGSAFRAPRLTLSEIGEITDKKNGVSLGIIRAQDSDNVLYEFTVDGMTRNLLPQIMKNPLLYYVIPREVDYSKARVKKDRKTNEYPLIGHCDNQVISCEIITRGVAPAPSIGGTTSAFNGNNNSQMIPLVYNTSPQIALSDPDYDPKDEDKYNKMAGQVAHISSSIEHGIMLGQGSQTMGINQKSGTTNNSDSQTNASQETNVGGGTMSTSPNFLQHFMIGLGNAVALPMPHMVNLIKMIAIGKFIKQVIGTKGKRIDAGTGDGSTKWQNGTGIYGLGDELTEAARGKYKK